MWLLESDGKTVLCHTNEDALAFVALNKLAPWSARWVEIWTQPEIKVTDKLAPRGRPFQAMSDERPFGNTKE